MTRISRAEAVLQEIFAPVGAGPAGTATTLISPSSIDGDIVRSAAGQLSLDRILTDIGTIVARTLADELEGKALKPSDYGRIEELPSVLANRIAKSLPQSEAFTRSFVEHLLMRG